MRHAVRAGEIVRFAMQRCGVTGLALPREIVACVYSSLDGHVGQNSGVNMLFNRAELENESPLSGRAPIAEELICGRAILGLDIYSETGADIASTVCEPARRRPDGPCPESHAARRLGNDGFSRPKRARSTSRCAGTSRAATASEVASDVGAQESGSINGSGVEVADQAAASSAVNGATAVNGAQNDKMDVKGKLAEDVAEEGAGAAHAHRVRAVNDGRMSAHDAREAREEHLKQIAGTCIKDEPAVPALSARGAALHGNAALSREAVVLPKTRCASIGCDWTGAGPAELRARVLELRDEALRDLAKNVST